MIEKKDILIAALEFSRKKFLAGEAINNAQLEEYLLEGGYATKKQSNTIQSLYIDIFNGGNQAHYNSGITD